MKSITKIVLTLVLSITFSSAQSVVLTITDVADNTASIFMKTPKMSVGFNLCYMTTQIFYR